jgi:hypothetical protein
MSNNFATYTERPDDGSTIRQPSVALLCVDSSDQFINSKRDLVTNSRLDSNSQYKSLIYKNQSLVTGKINRIALTEVNFNWDIPNVNEYNQEFTISFGIPWNATNTLWSGDGTPSAPTYNIGDLVKYQNNIYIAIAVNQNQRPDISPLSWLFCANETATVSIGRGFYNFTELANAVETDLNAALVAGGIFQTVITVLPDTLHFNIEVVVDVAYQTQTTAPAIIAPVTGGSLALTVAAGKSFVTNNWVTVVGVANDSRFIARVNSYNAGTGALQIDSIHNITPDPTFAVAQLYDVEIMGTPTVYKNDLGVMMGFDCARDPSDQFPEGPLEIEGGFALMSYTPYIDICSTRLTKNQHVYDNSSSTISPLRSVLTRIYLTPDGIGPRTDEDAVFGCRPQTIHKEFNFPKQIAWEPTEGVDSIDLEVLDNKGRVLYTVPLQLNTTGVILTGTTAQYQFTLQVSEN